MILLVGSLASLCGLILVIVAAVLVIIENVGTHNQLRQELQDIPDINGRSSAQGARLRS